MEPTATLFDRLGGIRRMADLLGEPPSTVQSWKNSGRIPAQKQPLVLEKAETAGVDITADDVVFPLGRPTPSSQEAA
jgi:hypothetical protein